jgi:hypothetical protein
MTYRPPIYSSPYRTVTAVEYEDEQVAVRIAGTARPFTDVLVIDADAVEPLMDMLAEAADDATRLIEAQLEGG